MVYDDNVSINQAETYSAEMIPVLYECQNCSSTCGHLAPKVSQPVWTSKMK